MKKPPTLYQITVTQVEVTTRKAYIFAMNPSDARRAAEDQDVSLMQDDDTTIEVTISKPTAIHRYLDVDPGWRDEEAYESVGLQRFRESEDPRFDTHIHDYFQKSQSRKKT